MTRDLLRVTRSAGQSYIQQWVEEKRGYHLVVACSLRQSPDHCRVVRTILAEINEGLVLTKRQAVRRRDELIGLPRPELQVVRPPRAARKSAARKRPSAEALA